MAKTKEKTYGYTLPDGTAVVLSALKSDDYRILNQWIQTEYLKNIGEATVG